MDRIKNSTWSTVLAIAGIVILIGMVVSGYFIWGIAILVVLLALAGGALLYRTQGPPRE